MLFNANQQHFSVFGYDGLTSNSIQYLWACIIDVRNLNTSLPEIFHRMCMLVCRLSIYEGLFSWSTKSTTKIRYNIRYQQKKVSDNAWICDENNSSKFMEWMMVNGYCVVVFFGQYSGHNWAQSTESQRQTILFFSIKRLEKSTWNLCTV